MNTILFGDFDWHPTISKGSKKSLAMTLATDENVLLHAYNRALGATPGLIRTPTTHINAKDLKPQGMDMRVEAVINVAVMAGRQALEQTKSDCLLAGSVGPIENTEGLDREEELERILSEPMVFLMDRGVDSLVLEGFSDLKQWTTALKTLKKVNTSLVPTAAFLKIDFPFDPGLLAETESLANFFEIELLGFEINWQELVAFPENSLKTDLPFGIKLALQNLDDETHIDLEAAAQKIKALSPTMLLGGQGTGADLWNRFLSNLRNEDG